ncbi:hypothetical protein KCU91_g152, partial [Aureobasidium melanogenum]
MEAWTLARLHLLPLQGAEAHLSLTSSSGGDDMTGGASSSFCSGASTTTARSAACTTSLVLSASPGVDAVSASATWKLSPVSSGTKSTCSTALVSRGLISGFLDLFVPTSLIDHLHLFDRNNLYDMLTWRRRRCRWRRRRYHLTTLTIRTPATPASDLLLTLTLSNGFSFALFDRYNLHRSLDMTRFAIFAAGLLLVGFGRFDWFGDCDARGWRWWWWDGGV